MGDPIFIGAFTSIYRLIQSPNTHDITIPCATLISEIVLATKFLMICFHDDLLCDNVIRQYVATNYKNVLLTIKDECVFQPFKSL